MKTASRVVAVIDDDASVRESLPDLLRELGFTAIAFATAEDFLRSGSVTDADCLLLDEGLPGMSGADLDRELRKRGFALPTIFMTGRDCGALQRRLAANGATPCLTKPFSDRALLAAIDSALGRG